MNIPYRVIGGPVMVRRNLAVFGGILRPQGRAAINLRPILTTNPGGQKRLSNINVPFQDDLTGADADDFGLEEFQFYQESEDIQKRWNELQAQDREIENLTNVIENLTNVTNVTEKESLPEGNVSFSQIPDNSSSLNPPVSPALDSTSHLLSPDLKSVDSNSSLENLATLTEPLIFRSLLKNPYLNLAIEDYIYNSMPLPTKHNFNRLMFYTNLPCVVIGKNQNPWKEVNLPLLNSLRIPLIRRKSGGGTVVHDLGNVNYSFMTSKADFDRFKFANIVRDAVNKISDAKFKLMVNERGDITTEKQPDGINYKVSGSAYKLSKGKSYHHGTMLLNLRLDILGKLLSREKKLGTVDAMNSIASVKSKVTNVQVSEEQFIEKVNDEFSDHFGVKRVRSEEEELAYEQNELLGLNDFMGDQKVVRIITIDENMLLPPSVHKLSEELKSWKWKFATTPKFTHEFFNEKFGFSVKFHVDKGAIVTKFELEFQECDRMLLEARIRDSFHYLEVYLRDGELSYTGGDIAGFVTDDMISDWIGESIDGTV